MRKLIRTFVCVALSAALVGVVAGSASASAPAKSAKKFCKQALNVGADSVAPGPEASEVEDEAAADLERNFKKLAKAAPTKKIKKASKTIANFYGEIADGADAGDLEDDAEDYATAIATFSQFMVSRCIGEALPDSIPGLEDLSDLSDYEIPGS